MAKIRGIFQFTGKIGDAVGMKGMNGENYARVRIRNPKNTITAANTEARVKVVLAGLLSKLVNKKLLVGMYGDSANARRSRFTSNIIRQCEVTTVDEKLTAKLEPAKLIFSEGNQIPVEVHASFVNNVLTVQSDRFPEGMDACMVVAVFTETVTGDYVEVQTRVITDYQEAVTFDSRHGGAHVYTIPIMQGDNATRVDYERAIANISSADNAYAVAAEMAQRGSIKYEASDYESYVGNNPQA